MKYHQVKHSLGRVTKIEKKPLGKIFSITKRVLRKNPTWLRYHLPNTKWKNFVTKQKIPQKPELTHHAVKLMKAKGE